MIEKLQNETCVLLCSLTASPPKFISFEQLMDAANGVKNMSLAHEIAVNNDFQIEKLQPEQNRLVCNAMLIILFIHVHLHG